MIVRNITHTQQLYYLLCYVVFNKDKKNKVYRLTNQKYYISSITVDFNRRHFVWASSSNNCQKTLFRVQTTVKLQCDPWSCDFIIICIQYGNVLIRTYTHKQNTERNVYLIFRLITNIMHISLNEEIDSYRGKYYKEKRNLTSCRKIIDLFSKLKLI